MWSRWLEMDAVGESGDSDESGEPKEPKHPPVAHAGPDKVVFDVAILDGSASTDSDGHIIAWDWKIRRRDNPADIRYASGVTATLTGLNPGFYEVTLTVTDNDNLIGTDTMFLAVYTKPNAELNVDSLAIVKDKPSQSTTASMSAGIGGFPTPSLDGSTLNARITIELIDALGDGADLIVSEVVPLTITNAGKTFTLSK